MPYTNVPEADWPKMDRCVEQAQAKDPSLSKEQAIAICHDSIVKAKSATETLDPDLEDQDPEQQPEPAPAAVKAGARHSKQDRAAIREIRSHAKNIHDLSKTLEPEDNDPDPEPAAEPEQAPEKTLVEFGGPIKRLDGNRIAGYLVRFTSPQDPDLEGDYFDGATDFDVEAYPIKATVYYNHGLDPQLKKRKLGKATVTKDEFGLWAEAQLDARDQYEKFILDQAEAGKLGWSSGTAGHLVEREQKSAGINYIKRWPLGLDASVTMTPAEARNIASLKELFQPAPAPAPDSTNTGENEMTPELEAKIAEIVENVMKKYSQAPAPAPEDAQPGGVAFKPQAPATKKLTGLGFTDDAVKGFLHWVKTGQKNAALIPARWDPGDLIPGSPEYKAALQGQTDSEGGYAVPDDFYQKIIAKRNEVSVVRLMGVTPIPTGRDRVLIPAEGTSATKYVVTAEEGAYDENEPTLGQVAVTIYKLTKLIKISEELETDALADFGTWLSGVWGRAQAAAENYYLVTTGTGGGMPQSMLAGATVANTTAGPTAITAAELVALLYYMPDAYSDNMALVMSRATLGSIRALASSSVFTFQDNPAGSGGPQTAGNRAGFINNIPVFTTSTMPAMTATLKSVLLVNPDLYGMAEREGMTVVRNPWLYQANGQIGLFSHFRQGGAVLQAEALYYLTQHA